MRRSGGYREALGFGFGSAAEAAVAACFCERRTTPPPGARFSRSPGVAGAGLVELALCCSSYNRIQKGMEWNGWDRQRSTQYEQ